MKNIQIHYIFVISTFKVAECMIATLVYCTDCYSFTIIAKNCNHDHISRLTFPSLHSNAAYKVMETLKQLPTFLLLNEVQLPYLAGWWHWSPEKSRCDILCNRVHTLEKISGVHTWLISFQTKNICCVCPYNGARIFSPGLWHRCIWTRGQTHWWKRFCFNIHSKTRLSKLKLSL